jgi:hypothetical protein
MVSLLKRHTNLKQNKAKVNTKTNKYEPYTNTTEENMGDIHILQPYD